MSVPATNLNPFSQPAPQYHSGALQVEQERATAEVQAMVLVAHKLPRNQRAAMDRILQACTRARLADQAIYTYPRGGTQVEGPSIRLAEAIAQSWGNINFGIREISQSGGVSTVEAYAWDLETNTRQSKTFQVTHERHTKKGKTSLTDPRDIYETVANQGARRLRACILGVIPGDIVESALEQCRITQAQNVGAPEEVMANMVEAFAKLGVSKAQLVKRLGHKIEVTTSAEVIQLKRVYRSINDGMAKPADFFEPADENVSAELPAMSEEYYNKNLDNWVVLIESGKKSADQILAMLGSKYTLSESQQEAIKNLESTQ